jgi:hypothetical protein
MHTLGLASLATLHGSPRWDVDGTAWLASAGIVGIAVG